MAVKHYKPTTPGRRGMTVMDYSELSKVAPEKSLLDVVKKNAGRNSYGRITVRHHGGGNRIKYRIIDFKRDKIGVPATVMTLEYDPNRSAFIALVQYEDGEKRYIIAPQDLKVGDTIVSGPDAVKAGVHAGKLVKAVCTLTGASGGGRPDSAMGGVGDLSKVDAALAQAADLVAGMLK